MMRDHPQINGPDTIDRAHHVELLIPGQVTQMRHPKLPEGDDASDRHSVLDAAVIILIFRFEIRTVRVLLAGAGEWLGDHLSRRAHQAPVQPSNSELIAGFCDHVLGLTVKLGIGCLQKGISSCVGLNVWPMVDELLDRDTPSQFSHATKMVAVPMCGYQIVDLCKPSLFHGGHNSACISDRSRSAVSRIDKYGLARRCHEKSGVTALHVYYVDVQSLARLRLTFGNSPGKAETQLQHDC